MDAVERHSARGEIPSMPFRSKETLESWVREFCQMGYSIPDGVRVIHQDGEGGADMGLVSITLLNPATVIAVQPRAPYALDWVVGIEPREEAVAISGPATLEYSRVLATLSVLCVFLQSKSEAHLHHNVA
jgi:hypothetical protein